MNYLEFGMEKALATATFSNCQKHQVGCAIMKGYETVATGYNKHVGQQSCQNFRETFGEDKSGFNIKHREWQEHNEIHAELVAMNNLSFVDMKGAFIFVNKKPCPTCMKSIRYNKFAAVVYPLENNELHVEYP